MKPLLIAFIVSLPIAGLAWWMQDNIGGTPPTQTMREMGGTEQTQQREDPELTALRQKAESAPDDMQAKQMLAQALMSRLAQTGDSSTAMETISVLLAMIAKEPDNRFALSALADVNFGQQVFDKAVEYYERFLKLEPKDDDARTRYASALNFSGRPEDAVRELKDVLSRRPKDFHALAYLSISLTSQGDRDEALRVGAQALEVAPNSEAKSRFQGFLDSVKDAAEGKAATTQTEPQAAPAPGSPVEAFIRNNQIAAQRFVRMERDGGTAKIYFRGFPIAAMPEGVKEKFMASLGVEGAKETPPVTKVMLIDADSNEVMLER